MYGYTYILLVATILILLIHQATVCPTHEFNLSGAANDVSGHYIRTTTYCDGQNMWMRISPATPERYYYNIGRRWAASGIKCQNNVTILLLRSYYNGGVMFNDAETWQEKTSGGRFQYNSAIKLVCTRTAPGCNVWSVVTPLTPGICVRQNCMKKPRATEALCHAPCGGCGKTHSGTHTCLAGTGGMYLTVVTITSRCNVFPCDGRVFSQKYEFIKYKFTAYRRWARAYMLRKCCVNFNANKAELAKRRYCSNVGGLL